MSEQIRQIAERLKELRNIAGLSPEDLAAQLKIPVDTYKEYESGEVDIPVSFLYKVASMFNVELTALLTGEGPKLHTYSLVRAGKGVSIERRKEYKYQSLAYNFANKKAEPFLVTVEPEDESTEVRYNSHTGQEFNYVLEGRMKVIIDGHEVVLNEGDSLYFDSGINHAMRALDNKPAKFLAIII
ncbi:transcriptional regulator [Clostridium thermosuccinogenes]|jgi:quercetin dioxygenase-like cupin family protein|uniref:Transcriptional regulator n=1 Tax=Clostridium thermosuccinogenes TaxID=84032 RepID=A0A2K2FHS6_9CLOT|nr:XRE family transcriptional regulator [Pseudoclostridium thermosuccinogenes]AUS95831.1 transcriptional regulator [Pseudoclostridium thermosuccinogenes]PNT93452.1 transcriptional regulator [Pseudoclostridium thermosuccinogenes]PNT98344.1 transcriptional regulator [Pseudoclostridium thermosuccinogenes]PNU00445.1 transcriptional regulator [Pseudoclostridium thermosuccinogenes]